MNKKEFRKIIKESVQNVLKETRDLNYLSNDIPNGSNMGKAWNTIVSRLETLMGEIESFNQTHTYTMRKMGIKEKLAIQSYMLQLQQVVQILEQLHPAVKVMTKIEETDNLSEEHPHGRYAQQAGATPFEPPSQGLNQ